MAQIFRNSRAYARRWPFLLLAYSSVGLAAVGVVLPGLPTTPFLLLAAWAAARGSDRLHAWLYGHRHFGPLLNHWESERAIARRAKLTAVVLLALSWTVLFLTTESRIVPVITALFFSSLALFLVTRPTPTNGLKPPNGTHSDEPNT
ncbi:MAG: YbaN family protein [Pseudomonadota bacterium]|nr:YbaN family protein [Pseudomonadota bacterium]